MQNVCFHMTRFNRFFFQVFQCLVVGGENAGEEALRNAESFVITDDEFQTFLDKHNDVTCLVPESNEKV